MNYKYIIIGINIVFASIIAIGVALYSGYETLIGVGFSLLALGLIISGIGLTFIEPLHRFFRDAARFYSVLAGKVLEDTGLMYGSAVQTCRERGLVVIAKGRAPCDMLRPGIGVVNGSPYISLPEGAIFDEGINILGEDSGPLEDILKDAVTHTYDIARDLVVNDSDGKIRVRVLGVRPDAMPLLRLPLNPFKILVTVLISKYLGRDAIVEGEEFVEDEYVISLRVV